MIYLGLILAIICVFLFDSKKSKIYSLGSATILTFFIPVLPNHTSFDITLAWIIQLGLIFWILGTCFYINRNSQRFAFFCLFLISLSILIKINFPLSEAYKMKIDFLVQSLFLSIPLLISFLGRLIEKDEWFLLSLQLVLARMLIYIIGQGHHDVIMKTGFFTDYGILFIAAATFCLFWGIINFQKKSWLLFYESFLSIFLFYVAISPNFFSGEGAIALFFLLIVAHYIFSFNFLPQNQERQIDYIFASFQRGAIGSSSFVLSLYILLSLSQKIPTLEISLWVLLHFIFGILGWAKSYSLIDKKNVETTTFQYVARSVFSVLLLVSLLFLLERGT